MTAYTKAYNVVTDNRDIGNALAGLLDSVGGSMTFSDGHGIPCYPQGTTFTAAPAFVPSAAAVRWASFPIVTVETAAVIEEFRGDGPYPLLNARGVTDAQIAAFKPHLQIEGGDRAQYEQHGVAFIQSLGFVVAA